MSFDPDILSTEDLVGIIESALGFDPSGVSREELLALFATIAGDDQAPPPAPRRDVVVDLTTDTCEPSHNNVDNHLSTLHDIEHDLSLNEAMSESMVQDVLYSKGSTYQGSLPVATGQSVVNTATDTRIFSAEETDYDYDVQELPVTSSVTESTESVTLSSEQASAVAMFCGITGSEPEYAKNLLEACAWDVDTAVSLHLDGGNTPGAVRRPPTPPVQLEPRVVRPPIPPTSTSSSSTIDMAEALRRFTSAGNDDPTNIANMVDMLHRLQLQEGSGAEAINDHFRRFQEELHQYHGLEDPDSPGRIVEEYDEEGIRRPDPVRLQRLISGNSIDQNYEVLGRVDDPSVDWMFEPPRDITFPGTLEQAREKAAAEDKWVLVNLQSHSEFTSQLLNRDTWSNESVREFLNASFVFWQRGHTSEQGRRYMQTYRLQEDNLPHIGIISPETGAKIFNWTGLIEPTELLDKLIEFLEKQSAKKSSAKKPPTQDASFAVAEKVTTADNAADTKVDEKNIQNEQVDDVKVESDKIDYGAVPPEPQDNDPNAIKVSIKFASGKPVMRKYLKTDLVRSLFAVAVSSDPANATRPFDLVSRFPARSLVTCLDMTLGECELAGGQVFHRWL